MRSNTVKNCDFLSTLYKKRLRDIRNLHSKLVIGCESQSITYLFAKPTSRKFTREVFEIVAFSTEKPPTYKIMVEQDEIIQNKIYQKELIKVI